MAKSKLRQWLEWMAHIETINSILQAEFVRTIFLPFVMSAAAIISGYMSGVPAMWILMAAALTFAGTIHGLLRGSEYIERKNPRGKLRFISSVVGIDIVHPLSPNEGHIDKIQLGMQVRNDATFPISVISEYGESEVEGITPPRTQYPRPAVTIPPGVTARFRDERMSMNNMPCKNLLGRYEIKLKYGLLGKERFELKYATSLEIRMQPSGSDIGIVDSPQPSSTL